MAASLRHMFVRELLRLMKDKGTKAKDRLEAARLYVELTGKQVVAPPPVALPKPEEPSSLE
jgi:hypothetical protein